MKQIKTTRAGYRLSRKENLSLLVLMLLSGLFILIPYLSRRNVESTKIKTEDLIQYLPENTENSLNESYKTKTFAKIKRMNSTGGQKIEAFEFDPNSLTEKDALRLGFSKYNYSNLQKYKSKGGVIRSPNDLKRIYGITPELVQQWTPYIRIENKENKSEQSFEEKKSSKLSYSQNSELNTSSANQLSKNLQIDFKLACRIINYGRKLGFYHSVSQLKEVYEMPDSVFQRIQTKVKVNGRLIKIDLDKSNRDSIARHPYIGRKRAGLIIKLRETDPASITMEALKNLYSDNPELFQRLLPYLNFNSSAHPHVLQSQ